jgi:hypothetical protein
MLGLHKVLVLVQKKHNGAGATSEGVDTVTEHIIVLGDSSYLTRVDVYSIIRPEDAQNILLWQILLFPVVVRVYVVVGEVKLVVPLHCHPNFLPDLVLNAGVNRFKREAGVGLWRGYLAYQITPRHIKSILHTSTTTFQHPEN